ncbi:MAG: tryptophan--tRNA ligase [Candidatus Saccharimonas sp.]
MAKPVILTGIRANNDLHIGNYFGAMLPLIDMAKHRSDEFDVNLFIPDLHSFTTPIDHSTLFDTIMSNARIYAAAGLPLDNDSIHLYRQSYVPAHSELTVLLNNFTGFGEMARMTQFKDKSAKLGDSQVSVGLFDYPVLMASDILLYNTSYVPVGDDQTQHLEITRDIAERINNRFGDIFTVPEPVKKQHEFFGKEQGLRIKDLVDPSKKMSKSDETGKGVIFLNDSPEVARKKIMSATTDDKASVQYNKESQPGITNLIDILALLRGVAPSEVAAEYEGMDRYGDFKKIVADEMATFLTNFQQRLAAVNNTEVLTKLESSERVMNEVANATLLRVQKAVGIRK